MKYQRRIRRLRRLGLLPPQCLDHGHYVQARATFDGKGGVEKAELVCPHCRRVYSEKWQSKIGVSLSVRLIPD